MSIPRSVRVNASPGNVAEKWRSPTRSRAPTYNTPSRHLFTTLSNDDDTSSQHRMLQTDQAE